MPSSASASMFRGCSLARREAKPGVVYCPLARPVFGMSRSLGGFGGGGRALEYLILAMKSCRAWDDDEEDILSTSVGADGLEPRCDVLSGRCWAALFVWCQKGRRVEVSIVDELELWVKLMSRLDRAAKNAAGRQRRRTLLTSYNLGIW